MPHTDILVLGAGPAALHLAGRAAEKGVQIGLVAPNPRARWVQNFGAWSDELDTYGVPRRAVEATWRSALVHTRGVPERDLDRRYARLHTARFQAGALERLDAAGAWLRSGRATAVTHDADGSVAHLADGSAVRASVVVDATGGASRLLAYGSGGRPGWQVAYGQLVEVDGHPWDMGEMVLMDFRAASEGRPRQHAWQDREETLPSFLYAMPLGRNLVFLEETVLVSRPEADMGELAARLGQRLRRMGIERTRVVEEEHCRIQMGGPLPELGQRLVGFGASAGLVHPATGYSLARSLRHAEEVAAALVEGLGAGSPAAASLRAWRALWPKDRVRVHQLHQFGMDVLCRLDRDKTGRFFDAFFDLPAEQWQGYLSATLAPAGVAKAMAGLFVRADLDLQRLLVGTGASPSGTALLRSVVGA
ncbi:MAG: lycopene cyclase family protein [Myxococcota bacterium]|nr:lycopene cyclase family protein [Myxococcota bacterium]